MSMKLFEWAADLNLNDVTGVDGSMVAVGSVLNNLCLRANPHGICYMKKSTLINRTHSSESTVKRCLRFLEKHNLIRTVTRLYAKNKANTANGFVVISPECVPMRDAREMREVFGKAEEIYMTQNHVDISDRSEIVLSDDEMVSLHELLKITMNERVKALADMPAPRVSLTTIRDDAKTRQAARTAAVSTDLTPEVAVEIPVDNSEKNDTVQPDTPARLTPRGVQSDPQGGVTVTPQDLELKGDFKRELKTNLEPEKNPNKKDEKAVDNFCFLTDIQAFTNEPLWLLRNMSNNTQFDEVLPHLKTLTKDIPFFTQLAQVAKENKLKPTQVTTGMVIISEHILTNGIEKTKELFKACVLGCSKDSNPFVFFYHKSEKAKTQPKKAPPASAQPRSKPAVTVPEGMPPKLPDGTTDYAAMTAFLSNQERNKAGASGRMPQL